MNQITRTLIAFFVVLAIFLGLFCFMTSDAVVNQYQEQYGQRY